MKLDDLKEILTPEDLTKILPYGRNKIYALLKSGEITARKSGSQYLILKENLFKYLGKTYQ